MGWKDTVHMCKLDGKSVFKPKHYLLYNTRGLEASYNEEHQEVKTTYCQMHSTFAKELDLILNQTKFWKTELATSLPKDTIELMNSSVHTVKDFKCISGQCAQCPGSNLTHDIGKAILNIHAISYYRQETIDKHMKKVPIQWIWPVLKNFSSGHFFLLWPFLPWPVDFLN